MRTQGNICNVIQGGIVNLMLEESFKLFVHGELGVADAISVVLFIVSIVSKNLSALFGVSQFISWLMIFFSGLVFIVFDSE